jgi:hypothetical protein
MVKKEIRNYIAHNMREQAFEKFIYALFEYFNYEVKTQVNRDKDYVDMELVYRGNINFQKYICEIKYFSKQYIVPININSAIKQLSTLVNNGEQGLLITNSICSSDVKIQAIKEHNIIIFDLTNILYFTNLNSNLYRDLLGILEFSVSGIEPIEPSIHFLKKEDIVNNENQYDWSKKFADVVEGIDNTKYEKLCVEVLRLLFSDYLDIWSEQQKSNGDLYRFDLICKIKQNVDDEFFSTLNKYFNTKYVVFEFKNYTSEITQKEIYTTEKYLYEKALRKVAIIITRNGLDKNAYTATKGSLREQGKLIIALHDVDMLGMIHKYYEDKSQTDILSDKLDKLLIELEK